jgi:hypothetical protein
VEVDGRELDMWAGVRSMQLKAGLLKCSVDDEPKAVVVEEEPYYDRMR